jgi:hypothetical protein
MKNLSCIFFMLLSIEIFSQEKKEIQKIKDIDKEANRVIDSLSKVYKVKIYSTKKERLNGVVTTSIC